MKKLFLAITLLLISISSFGQSSYTKYGYVYEYAVNDSAWKKVNVPYLIYMDFNFDFISIENENSDRYILNDIMDVKDVGDTSIYVFNAVCYTGEPCSITLELSKTFKMTIEMPTDTVRYLIADVRDGYPKIKQKSFE